MRLYVRTSRNTGVGLGFWDLCFLWPLILVWWMFVGTFWLIYWAIKGLVLLAAVIDRDMVQARQRRGLRPPPRVLPRPPAAPSPPTSKSGGHAWG